MGAGTILMPLSTYAFITLPAELRTDGAGLYSLLRQIGCAAGVAVMTAVLEMKLGPAHAAAGQGLFGGPEAVPAFAACFRIMAIAAVLAMPAVLWFRPPGRATTPGAAAPESCD
jgi:DHA2 family multidrug resistance protein